MVRKIILSHKRAPGDVIVMTGLVRDIALAHPGKFRIGVDTSAMDVWRHNPYVDFSLRDERKRGGKGIEYIKLEYGRGIRDQNYKPAHFLSYFHLDFERQCNVRVPLMLPYPDLHLSETERTIPPVEGRYWVIISGGKSDFPIKVWEATKFQQVVDRLTGMGLGVVQVGGNDSGHWHPMLHNVLNLVGHTNLRDLIRLIYHADGVICGVTCLMHIAAALHRPCVVIAGGREAWWWEAYVRENHSLAPLQDKIKVPHQFLHTIGLLECCRHHGCWRNKVVPIRNDKSVCYQPVMLPGQPVARCMHMITSTHVMEAVMKYYTDKTLPPIQSLCEAPQISRPPDVVEVPVVQAAQAPSKQQALLSLFDVPNGEQKKDGQPHMATSTKMATRARIAIPPGTSPQEFLKRTTFRVNPQAGLEGRGPGHDPSLVAQAPGMPHPAVVPHDPAIFDHEDIGGGFTAFILFYGPDRYFDLHRRCLESFLATVPRDRIDLRVGSNELNAKSLAMIQGYVDQGVITKHYRHPGNDYKYPVMREMFHDQQHPIRTKWVLWFDDDSICDQTPAWLNVLVQKIIEHHRRDNAHMFGAPFVWTLQAGQKEWYESRPWHRSRPWRLHNGKPSPSGNKIIFCTGGFWALTHQAIVKCDIPDPGIAHNHGDVIIGEQLYQNGFRMKSFNARKQFVLTSSVKRRGVTTPVPGTHNTPRLVQV